MDDDDDKDEAVWNADVKDAVAAADGGLIDAALVQRDGKLGADFRQELEPELPVMDGPRTGARGGRGGGESVKKYFKG